MMFCIYAGMPPGMATMLLKWSVEEKAWVASCCAEGVWEEDVTFMPVRISRASLRFLGGDLHIW